MALRARVEYPALCIIGKSKRRAGGKQVRNRYGFWKFVSGIVAAVENSKYQA